MANSPVSPPRWGQCETLCWELAHDLVVIPNILMPRGLLLTAEQRSWVICPKSTVGGGGRNQIKSEAHCFGQVQQQEKGRHGRNKSRCRGARATRRQLPELHGSCPSSWRSQLFTQGLLMVTFHTAESYQEENTHPRLVFGSWLLNLFSKSLWQISHTAPPKRITFPFIKLKWMHLHFSAKRAAAE